MDPWQYTLRELTWRADVRRMESWDQFGWVCFHIPKFSQSRKTLADYNPLRAKEQAHNMGQVMMWLEEQKLPKYESEENVESRWEEYLRAQNDRQ